MDFIHVRKKTINKKNAYQLKHGCMFKKKPFKNILKQTIHKRFQDENKKIKLKGREGVCV